jgi:dimethylhistidine N-methyltransferase
MRNPISDFETDVIAGLSDSPKHISSRWFYDETGDALFQQIMQLPEYYLTRAEYDILQKYAAELVAHISGEEEIQCIEFGAGDGLKSRLIIQAFLKANRKFRFVPVDISINALNKLTSALVTEFPQLDILPLQSDYFSALEHDALSDKGSKLVLFLGSNVGNLNETDAPAFFGKLNQSMQFGDTVLTGFDRVKDPEIILAAYNDRQGITRAFNINLLTRINRELGGNFDSQNWSHKPQYDPIRKAATSSLVSMKTQVVKLELLNREFYFEAGEELHTEISRKFTLEDIHQLSLDSGFKLLHNFELQANWFTDSWWSKG